MFNRTFKLTTLAIATSLLAACGGGGGGGSSEAPFAPKTISGTAVDFYVAGADVDFTVRKRVSLSLAVLIRLPNFHLMVN